MIFINSESRVNSRLFSVIRGFRFSVIRGHFFNVIRGHRPANPDCRITSGNDNRVERGEVTGLLRCARNDICCLGRSMIEMLGVLAIIAVLSVCGIAGYSKAMLAYKSNIQRNILSELLYAMIEIKPKLGTNLAEFQNITYLVDSLGYLPEGTTYENNTIYDKSGNRYEIHKYNKDNEKYYVMEIYFENKENSLLSIGAEEFCHNMIWAIKPIISEIYSINFRQDYEDRSEERR